MSEKYGVINEIGDLGLGFTQVSEKDQKTINEQKNEKEGKNEGK